MSDTTSDIVCEKSTSQDSNFYAGKIMVIERRVDSLRGVTKTLKEYDACFVEQLGTLDCYCLDLLVGLDVMARNGSSVFSAFEGCVSALAYYFCMLCRDCIVPFLVKGDLPQGFGLEMFQDYEHILSVTGNIINQPVRVFNAICGFELLKCMPGTDARLKEILNTINFSAMRLYTILVERKKYLDSTNK